MKEFVSRQQYAALAAFPVLLLSSRFALGHFVDPARRFGGHQLAAMRRHAHVCLYQTGVVSTGGSISTITRPLFQQLGVHFILMYSETHTGNNRHSSGNTPA